MTTKRERLNISKRTFQESPQSLRKKLFSETRSKKIFTLKEGEVANTLENFHDSKFFVRFPSSTQIPSQGFPVIIFLQDGGDGTSCSVNTHYHDLYTNYLVSNDFIVVIARRLYLRLPIWQRSIETKIVLKVIEHLVFSTQVDNSRIFLCGRMSSSLGAWHIACKLASHLAGLILFDPEGFASTFHLSNMFVQVFSTEASNEKVTKNLKSLFASMKKGVAASFSHEVTSLQIVNHEGNIGYLIPFSDVVKHRAKLLPPQIFISPDYLNQETIYEVNNEEYLLQGYVGIRKRDLNQTFTIVVSLVKQNTFSIYIVGQENEVGVIICLNDKLVNMSKPIEVTVERKRLGSFTPTLDENLARKSAEKNGRVEQVYTHFVNFSIYNDIE